MGITATAWFFGVIFLSLIFIAVLFTLWPLWRARNEAAKESRSSRKDTNIALYEERMADLQRSVALGEISQEDARLQEQEAGRHLLSDTDSDPGAKPEQGGGRWLFVGAVLFLPVFSILVYLQGDGWRLLNADDKTVPWDFVLHRAQARLAKNPEDIETLTFLARSYRALERYDEAVAAYHRANALSQPAVPELLVEEGEMLALQDEGNLRGRPTELVTQALSLDPEHGRALWYAGLAALQREDKSQAVTYWQALSRQTLPQSFRQVLERQLTRLGAEPAATPAATEAERPTGGDAVIRVTVSVSPELVTGVNGDTPVFIYAKAKDGSPRPLAAQRVKLDDLPMTVTLANSMQMADGPALTDFDEWILYARVALGGGALAQAGDPIGQIEISKEAALSGTPLTINTRWVK